MRLGAFLARATRTMRLCSSDARSRRQPSPIPWMDNEGRDLTEAGQADPRHPQWVEWIGELACTRLDLSNVILE
jgi:hypothetical protein